MGAQTPTQLFRPQRILSIESIQMSSEASRHCPYRYNFDHFLIPIFQQAQADSG
ncbi:MAG: hypothetical protein AAF485_04545 [Chloroflexota bacterium]